MFGQFLGGEQPRNRPQMINFFKQLRVYPAVFALREDIEIGDKILLPASALNELYPLISSRNKDPMVFCIKNGARITYCGVLQFVAQQGVCYIPTWMFKMLKFVEHGQTATVALVPDIKKKAQKGLHFVKLRPHKTKFIELDNPKAILEYQLRNFTCLHEGDTIQITTFSGKFDIDIMEIKPKNEYDAICIIDADVEVDFAPPLDYEEPSQNTQQAKFVEQSADSKTGFFGGKGLRIDERQAKPGQRKSSAIVQEQEYDPRKHRIHRGVRKNTNDYSGTGVKIGVPIGTKKR